MFDQDYGRRVQLYIAAGQQGKGCSVSAQPLLQLYMDTCFLQAAWQVCKHGDPAMDLNTH
jgi:hypothetical protein